MTECSLLQNGGKCSTPRKKRIVVSKKTGSRYACPLGTTSVTVPLVAPLNLENEGRQNIISQSSRLHATKLYYASGISTSLWGIPHSCFVLALLSWMCNAFFNDRQIKLSMKMP